MKIIKKADKNKYIITKNNIFVRDFTSKNILKNDLNENLFKNDINLFLDNEYNNNKNKIPYIDRDLSRFLWQKVLIVSDGYDFVNKHKILAELPKDIKILAVNGALRYWQLLSRLNNKPRSIECFISNNPYKNAIDFLPTNHSYYPNAIFCSRTNHELVCNYNGNKYLYESVGNKNYKGKNLSLNQIEDYRNPICAAIELAYKFGVKQLCLFCCDYSMKEYRNGTVKLDNGLYFYPHQKNAFDVVEAKLYWLNNIGIKIADCSSGPKYDFIDNINDVLTFFS